MKSIEIINLRAPGGIGCRALSDLQKSIGTITEKGFDSLKFLTRPELETDIGIHISWSGPELLQKSATGTRIAQYFKKFGLVNHSLWIESDQGPAAVTL